jgi:hypothetical protein
MEIFKRLSRKDYYIVLHKHVQYDLAIMFDRISEHRRIQTNQTPIGDRWHIRPSKEGGCLVNGLVWNTPLKMFFESLPPLSFLVMTGLSFEEVERKIEEKYK